MEELAKTLVSDGQAPDGGKGWFGRGKVMKPVENAAFSAKLGKLVGPIQSRIGWHILRLTGRREPGKPEQLFTPEDAKKRTPE